MGRRRSSANKPRTLIAIVQDCSGSMSNRRHATISGFNEYLGTLRQEASGRVLITLTQFSDWARTVYSAKPLDEIREMHSGDYYTQGMTALYDAVGTAIKDLERKARPQDRVTMVIMTDGGENSSKEYSHYTINQLLNEKRRHEWEFVFFGAGQEAWNAGANLGFTWNNSILYGDSDVHHHAAFQDLGHAHSLYSTGQTTMANYLSTSDIKANLEAQAGSWTQAPSGVTVQQPVVVQTQITNNTLPVKPVSENVCNDGHENIC